MKNFFFRYISLGKIFLVLIFLSSMTYAQQNSDFVGRHIITGQYQGMNQEGYFTVPELNNSSQASFEAGSYFNNSLLLGTTVRWNFTDGAAIGDHCAVSGNGEYSAVAWDLNNVRISLYGNTNSTPIWEYSVTNNYQVDFVSLNYAGDLIAAGAAQNVYVFTNTSNVPILNIDLTAFGGAPTAGPVALTQNSDFLVATSDLTDSSFIFGFNTSSSTPVWTAKLIDPTGISGNILGVKLSGNDSLMIVNTYGYFWVMKTYTGNIIYENYINPLSNSSGTQAFQGINYDGTVIATVNYFGYVRVFQWDGSTYNLLWQDQEPPGTYYNWANCVSVSANGEYVAVGTLIFVSSSSFNGTVKLYKTSQGPPAQWIYDNCGDNVTSVSFNNPGNVLEATTWGALDNSTPDLYIFKTWEGNTPIFTINTGGSFFDGAISFDGGTVFSTGKAVHARTFGNGGLAYNVSVDTSDSNVPVELTSFTANTNDGDVILNWATSTETNNRGFEVERKTNDGQFTTIAFLEGHGTTTQVHQYSYVDKKINEGNYTYRLKQVDFNGSYVYSDEAEVEVKAPAVYSLDQNYPNPFNPSTVISYQLAVNSHVTLKIYDVLGREAAELVNKEQTAGEHEINFNAVNLTSGVYFYKLEAKGVDGKNFTSVKKMILTK